MGIYATDMAMIEALSKVRPPSESLGTEETALDDSLSPAAYLYRDVCEEIRFNGAYQKNRISGGIILGRHFKCEDDGSPFVEVEAFVASTQVSTIDELQRHFRMHWKAASTQQASLLPDGEIIGWFVSTGGTSVDPGQSALLLHRTFFSHAWQIGLWVTDNGVYSLQPNAQDTFQPAPAGLILE